MRAMPGYLLLIYEDAPGLQGAGAGTCGEVPGGRQAFVHKHRAAGVR